jgi:hypothetical protein
MTFRLFVLLLIELQRVRQLQILKGPGGHVIFRCFQDGFPGDVDEDLGFFITDLVDVFRRNHDLLTREPMTGLHNQMNNRPALLWTIKSVT